MQYHCNKERINLLQLNNDKDKEVPLFKQRNDNNNELHFETRHK